MRAHLSRRRTTLGLWLLTVLATSLPFAAPKAEQAGAATQPPRVTNGRLVPQAAGSSLDQTFRRLVAAESGPGWIGYNVPAVNDSDHHMCCNGNTWISDGVVISDGRLATWGPIR
jgi:hypothetical protein